MVRLQNEGFVSIYMKYWRWWPVIKKHGILGLILTYYRMIKMFIDKIKYKTFSHNKTGWTSWTKI